MMNSKLRRILMTLACAVLLVSLSVGATLAYLTSTTGVVTNTFTVGKVTITLDEYKVDEYGVADTTAARVTTNEYKLIPNHTYTKDPTVHVKAGSEVCYLFVKVANGIADIEKEGATTIAAQMAAKGWTLLQEGEDSNIYHYNTTVDARNVAEPNTFDVVVFENIVIADNADVASYEDAEVTITAYAIQADGFSGKTFAEIWTAGQFE